MPEPSTWIASDPITVAECEIAVTSDTAGAVVTFVGIVRDHDGGKGVRSLEYEGHPSAAEVLARVAAEVSASHPEVRIAAAHRVGALGIGDVALACAVASAHRGVAFAACALLVDEIKLHVPIWKHQHFVDGTSEWVASLG